MSKTPIVDLIDQSQALTTPMVGQLDDTLPNDDHEISPSSTILSHLDVDEIVKVIGEGDEEETESDEDEALLTQNLAPSPPPLNQPSNHINNVPENVMIQEQRNKVTVESSTEEQGQSGAGEMGEVILSKPTKPTNSFPRAGKKLREGSYVQGWTFE